MQREPIALVQAKGKKHLTKAEINQRLDQEVQVPKPEKAKPPTWLKGPARRAFVHLGNGLLSANLYTELDCDLLAFYVTYHQQWIETQSNDAYKKCLECGNLLGLSVTARCKLVMPATAKPQATSDPFMEMLEKRMAR